MKKLLILAIALISFGALAAPKADAGVYIGFGVPVFPVYPAYYPPVYGPYPYYYGYYPYGYRAYYGPHGRVYEGRLTGRSNRPARDTRSDK